MIYYSSLSAEEMDAGSIADIIPGHNPSGAIFRSWETTQHFEKAKVFIPMLLVMLAGIVDGGRREISPQHGAGRVVHE